MIYPDMATGETMADIVVWRWLRRPERWEATLKDGSVLRALLKRKGRRVRWNAAAVFGRQVWSARDYFGHPDAAQKAAFDEWRRRQP